MVLFVASTFPLPKRSVDRFYFIAKKDYDDNIAIS